KVHEVLASTAYVVEGVPTTKAAYRLGEKLGVELPIIEVMYRVLFENFPPQKAVEVLMSRDRRHELERLD
ncbi:MAG: glycerol-3-phosphate dehydrogenase, partial [Clostridia bacterium]|nr:glycerol-3-phosphate dehydrogenase [Clostridia bacterium]